MGRGAGSESFTGFRDIQVPINCFLIVSHSDFAHGFVYGAD